MSTSESMISDVAASSSRYAWEKRLSPAEQFRRVITCSEMMLDFLTAAASVYTAYFLYLFLGVGKHVLYSATETAVVACSIALLTVLLLERDGAYKGSGSLLQIRETERAMRVPAVVMLLFVPIVFFLDNNFSRGTLITTIFVLPFFLVIEKYLFSQLVRQLHARGYGSERVLIYGGGYTGRRVLSALLHSPKLGFKPLAIVDDNPELCGTEVYELGYRRHSSVPVLCGPPTPEMLRSLNCDRMVAAIPSLSSTKLEEMARTAHEAELPLAFLSYPSVHDHHWTESIDIDGMLLTSFREADTPWHYRFLKRAFDLVVAPGILLMLSPVLLIIALLVRLDSPGPIFFVQKRVGKDGRLFNMYKFRSMRTDAPKYGDSPTLASDPRITRIGRFLRKTSLDEIPQLFNVVRGEMSLVGPRPEMPFIVEKYDTRQRQRLQVVPGITGLWQLSADRAFHIHENIQYDLYYIRNRTFFMDLAILVHTAFFAMHGV